MKPKIGRVVYTVNTSYAEISEEIVGYLGKDTFIVSNFENYNTDYEFAYDSYGATWFTSFDKAKSYLKKAFKRAYPNDKFKLDCIHDVFTGGRFWRIV